MKFCDMNRVRLRDCIKLGAGFYIGYTVTKALDEALGKAVKPVINKLLNR